MPTRMNETSLSSPQPTWIFPLNRIRLISLRYSVLPGAKSAVTRNMVSFLIRRIEFIARGTLQRIAWKNGGFTISSGTSLACAYFTGITAKTMQSFNHTSSIDALKARLKESATPGLTPLQFGGKAYNDNVPMIKSDGVKTDLEGVFKRRFSDWIGNLAVFPASEKEMNAFSDFPEYCISPVVQYFDYPRNLAYASPGKTEPSGDVTRSDRFDSFDTLVTGLFHRSAFRNQYQVWFGTPDQVVVVRQEHLQLRSQTARPYRAIPNKTGIQRCCLCPGSNGRTL